MFFPPKKPRMGAPHMDENQLKEYLHIIWKRLWIIILIIILATAASGLVSYFALLPEYKTYTTLMLSKPRSGIEAIQYDDILLNQKLVATYGEIVKSRLVSNEVINNLNLKFTPEQLEKKVKVTLVTDTEIIKIVVTDNDPELAAKIANEIAQVFKKNVVEIMKIENVQIIDEAEVPTTPVTPRPMLNMSIAGALGMILGTLLVFLIEYLDNAIKTASDIGKYLGFSVIGMIPKSKNKDLIIYNNLKSPESEAYRTLRTNIQFSSVDRHIKTMVITSSGPGEGKSTIISNLAISMALTEKKVLLIDSDLRKPRIHCIFNTDNSCGLTTVLAEAMDYKDCIVHTDIKGLDILTSGPIPPNPVELLGSNKMKKFLETIAEEYDIVLLDTPPVGVLTDGAVVSTKCDGVILVCAIGQTKIKDAVHSKEHLQKVNANILGAVMNKVPIDKTSFYKYYHYR